jgi:thiamine biosynthesis lipoprotein
VRRFSHEAMATVFEVHAVHDDGRYAEQAAQAAFDLVDRLERELSRFIPNSDISRINDLAPASALGVAPTTLECLVIARHAFEPDRRCVRRVDRHGARVLELDADACVIGASAEA